MMAHGQIVHFWERDRGYTVKTDTVKNAHLLYEHFEVDWEGPQIFVPVMAVCEDTGASDEFEFDWEGPKIFVPVMAVCEDTGAGDGFDEVDWEGPEIFVPVSVACDNTGAGDTTQLQPSLRESPDAPLPIAPELQQDVQAPDVDQKDATLVKLDWEDGSLVSQPPAEVVAAGSFEDKEPERNTVVKEGDGVLLVEGPRLEIVCAGPSRDGFDAVNNLMALVPLPSQTPVEPTFVKHCSMNTENCTVAFLNCFLFLLVGQAHKLFQLRQYKAFKRKRWKCVY